MPISCINKYWHIYAMEQYVTTKKNEKNGSFAQQIDGSHTEIDKEARQKIIEYDSMYIQFKSRQS